MAEQEANSTDTPVSDNREDETAVSTVPSPELLMKHPLEHRWSLWYFKNDRTKDWKENLKQVSTFAFVEDFWA